MGPETRDTGGMAINTEKKPASYWFWVGLAVGLLILFLTLAGIYMDREARMEDLERAVQILEEKAD